jgi:hypothetical protein
LTEAHGEGDHGAGEVSTQVADVPAGERREPREIRRGSSTALDVLVKVLITVAIVVLSISLGHQRRATPALDVLDEDAHYDYALSLYHGHVPAWGDLYRQQTLRLISCVGIAGALLPTSCAVKPRNPREFPSNGYSYEAQQPPLGYLPYVATLRPSASPSSAILAARRGGIIWTALAGLLLLLVGLVYRFGIFALASVLCVSLLSPWFVHAAATVNNDSSAIAAGALGLLILGVTKRAHRWVALTAGFTTGVLIGLLKGTFVIVPLVLLVRRLVLAAQSERGVRGALVGLRQAKCEGAMFVGAVLSYGGWALLQNARASVPQHTVLQSVMGFSVTSHLRPDTILKGVQDVLSLYTPIYPNSVLFWVWNLLLFGCVFGVIVIKNERTKDIIIARAEAWGIIAGLAVLVVGWPTLVYIQGHFDFSAPTRYALPLAPLIGFILIRALPRRALLAVGVLLPLAAALAQFVVIGY